MQLTQSTRSLALAVLAAVTLAMASTKAARADEVDDLTKQANSALREATALMFSGKFTESSAKLDEMAEILDQIEAKDPNNSKLKSLRSKHEKMQKDLSRRLPKDDSAKDSTAKSAPKAKGNGKLPYHASQALRDVKRIESHIDHCYSMIENSKTTDLSKPVEDYYHDIEDDLEEMTKALQNVRDMAAEEGVTSHPDIDAVQAYIDEAPDRLSKVQAEMKAFAEQQASQAAADEAARKEQQAAKAVNVDQAQADWKELAPLCQKYMQTFMSESAAKKMGPRFQQEWIEWKKQFEPVRDRFRSRYGTSNPEIYEAFKDVPQPEGVDMPATQAAGLANDIDLPACEARFADWAAEWATTALGTSQRIALDNAEKIELKYVRAEDAARYFKLAQKWNAGKDLSAKIAEAEAAVAEALPVWKKTLAELKWPGHNAAFAGPGDPNEIAEAALAFLREHPSWSKPEYDDEHIPFAACVEGKGWDVWKRAPLTDVPTQYSVDVLVAFTGQADPDLVYVYHMVFYTAEAAGVQPGLPLHYANSKQYASFRMLKANVPPDA